MLRVLDRRIDRWVREQREEVDQVIVDNAAAAARLAARSIVAQLKSAGALDDAVFATQRAGNLARKGRSSRVVQSHLLARGIDDALVTQAVAEQAIDELPSALIYLRRRRLGGFRAGDADDEKRRKELAALARAGFPAEVARQALRLSCEEAIDIIARFRRGEPML